MPKRGINAEKVLKRLIFEKNTQFLDLMSEKVVHNVDRALIFRIFERTERQTTSHDTKISRNTCSLRIILNIILWVTFGVFVQ